MVEATTPQLLQQVLAMTTQDWINTSRCHFRELAVLLEFVNRHPQMYRDYPSAFEAAAELAEFLSAPTDAAAAGQPLSDTAAAAASAAMHQGAAATQPQLPLLSGTASEAAAAAALSSDTDWSLPWERDPVRLLVKAVCKQGPMFQSMLMHHSMALFMAGCMNLETMQVEAPEPAFWRRAVDRLHLSPSQVLHFRVANHEYRRLTRAASAAGLDLVQHTKEFSLSVAAAKFAKASCALGSAPGASSSAGADAAGLGSSLQQLDAKLRRHLNSFFTNAYLVNTFCANVLTPYQHAIMWSTSYPYFPVLGAMAEALEALPPSDCAPLPPHVQARISANIQQHTACRSAVIAQQRKDLCWWEEEPAEEPAQEQCCCCSPRGHPPTHPLQPRPVLVWEENPAAEESAQ
ncbi:hypothetical protein OEZ85_008921 [Tetradesmus obliquus]|uniref:Uncharacterized protein n=1 Tax=Tetradesmus obliquus TaxID=3088 RepID=A0ABY8TKJ3_TETOB|nr:hypothetical protein OEZ85_008921 [Tetradesmus obliquus]